MATDTSAHPSRLEVLAAFRQALRDPTRIGDVAVYKSELGGTRARPEIERRLDAVRHRRPSVDVDALAQLPAGTFGGAYARFLRRHQLHPFAISDRVAPELVTRNAFTVRYALVHDMVHVLLGFDTSWPGEVGVWAFVGRQNYSMAFRIAAWFALAVALFRSPLQLGQAWRNFRRGRRLAIGARSLVVEPLEDRFAEDLDDVRVGLGLVEAAPALVHAGA